MDGVDVRIAESVKSALSASQISQMELASALGICESTVTRRLNGTRQWSLNEVLKLSRFLDIPLLKLIGEDQ